MDNLLLRQAVAVVQKRRIFQPRVALILGSGLGELTDALDHASVIPYTDIPGFPAPRVQGHAGSLALGYLGGIPVVVLSGRCHRYEGYSTTAVQFPTAVAGALGAETLIATNAAGGLNRRFRPGDLMVIDSHIDLLWESAGRTSPLGERGGAAAFSLGGYPAPPLSQPIQRCEPFYSPNWIARAHRCALRCGLRLHQGTYVATLGPTYETRAEYNMFRRFGGDAAGMSTVPETIAARRQGMEVAAFSVITNVACTDAPHSTHHGEVVDWAHRAGPRLARLLTAMLDDLAGQPD